MYSVVRRDDANINNYVHGSSVEQVYFFYRSFICLIEIVLFRSYHLIHDAAKKLFKFIVYAFWGEDILSYRKIYAGHSFDVS